MNTGYLKPWPTVAFQFEATKYCTVLFKKKCSQSFNYCNELQVVNNSIDFGRRLEEVTQFNNNLGM